jgi:hypothetical protein
LHIEVSRRIAIIEIYSHHVFVHTLAASLLASGHKVTVYVSHRIFKDLAPMFTVGEIKPTFCVSKKNENDFSFLRRIKLQIEREHDLLFINSVQGYRIGYFYLLKFKIPTIAAAGRISEFFGSHYKFLGFSTFRQILHHNYTKYLLPKIIKRFSGLIVHTQKARELAFSNGYNRPIHCMPFSLHVFNYPDIIRPKNKIHFLITGSLSARSRDYFAILDLFEKIWDSGVKTAELTVLSSPRTDYGFKVYNEMQRLEDKGYPIRYFSGWIPEEEFVSQSSKADFLIAPILKEYYGAGEITSVEVESVRMGIPAFYPDWYYVDHGRLDSSIFYSSFAHLHTMIMEFVSDTSRVESIRLRALKNAETFSVDQVSKKLSEFLNQQIFNSLSDDTRVMKNDGE